MNRALLLLSFLPFLLLACSPDKTDETALLPVITWDEISARFRIYTDETLTLVPVLANTDETTTYTWKMDGRVVGTESHYSFVSHETGEFFISLTVTNRHGSTTDEAKITVQQNETADLPIIPQNDSAFSWRFPWTEIHLAQGRSLRVRPYFLENVPADAEFSWTLDGAAVQGQTLHIPVDDDAVLSPEIPVFVFAAAEQGRHTLCLTMTASQLTASQDFTLHVCPPPGTYRRSLTGRALINKVHAYVPAPGHQVNGYIIVGEGFPPACTHQQACDTVLAHFQRRWSVSLGAQGGYLVASFDHSVRNSGGDWDLCIKGNPYNYQSEPGIIWVSQDDNGDGQPNDQWFELAGSEYGRETHTTEYAITYYRPAARKSAIAWRDCFGQTGYVPYMSYWNPSDTYWQPWVEGNEHTYYGSRLQDRSTYANGISDIPPYDWGYADNLGSDFTDGPAGKMNYFRFSNARAWDGQPAELEYIDFIRIQTAQTGSTPNLGDISSEIYYISDYHCEK
ncbi:MAG: hypothetical protein J5545_00505 [Bacteroidaceae bacterium]|nr:hypothetical protein [Bacteroidaceae bacterium]